MTTFCCESRRDSIGIAFVVSLIVGIIAAFLQITGVITLTPIFSIFALGIAIVYLAVVLLASALTERTSSCRNCCVPLTSVLLGVLGTILVAVILLAITFAATSVIGAIFVGALFFFFTLLITSTACLARCFADCND